MISIPGFEVIGKEEQEAVNDVFEKGGVLYRYGWDDKRQRIFRVNDFERAFAEKINAKYSLAVSSGTAALKTVLRALDVGPDDEVITQSHTFIATVEAIVETGATPIITEIDKTLNMDPEDLKKKITKKTKIIIPVHMSGVAAHMDKIMAIAQQNKIKVLEDNAQSPGGTFKGKFLGTIGDVGIFSFDFGKMLTTGEGGMIVTNDVSIFKACREYADHGHELNPNVPRGEDTRTRTGFNYKITELQGAVGLAQLKKLDFVLARHRENKKILMNGLKDLEGIEFRENPDPDGDVGDSLTIFFKDRETTKKFLDKWTLKGFSTKNLPDAINWHFAGTWDHMLNQYGEYKNKNLLEEFKQSNTLLRKAIAIPIFINMDNSQIKNIVTTFKEIFEEI